MIKDIIDKVEDEINAAPCGYCEKQDKYEQVFLNALQGKITSDDE